ncbi:cell division protein FtsN [Rodentibacter caecimuris]|uniref:Cell division protein FtsN n=1 Tax=Rodentibacter caecimuris TaxID=1796644 RepID=A0ABX3KXR5_9PAST|nr:cell division protein FtsN [Rodentibacter heylii]
MAHRDFAARRSVTNKKKKSKGSNKNLLICCALAIVFSFIGGLYFLKSNKAAQTENTTLTTEKTQQTKASQPKSVLPTRPEEVWSYIKALETRTVPVDKNVELTDEQRKILAQMEKEQKEAEAARKLMEQRKQETPNQVGNTNNTGNSVQQTKLTETKTDLKLAVTKEDPIQNIQTKSDTKKVEPIKSESAKKIEQKTPEVKTTEKVANKRFGLQCGAFKNKTQAENLQARLTLSGLNTTIVSSEEWNRVRVGPFNNRESAVQAQEKAKSVTGCVVIGI